jgi:RNA polymerase sigma-70 factor (ECF subfamily)
MDEASAIQLCLSHKDPTGFEFLVKKYRREAFFHAVAVLGNQEDAADACQESFSRAFAAMPRLEALDQFYPWFYRILRNCCLNMLSRKKTARRYQTHQKTDLELHVETENPSSLLEKSEEKELVWEVLGTLNPEFREILTMKYINENNYEEIAALLNIPRGTVMSRLYYARKAFKDAFVAIETSHAKTR